LGFDTNDFVRLFLTPINRGSPHIDKTTIAKEFQKISQEFYKEFQSLSFTKDFSKPKFPTPNL